jgi:hypothetical protein
MKYMLNILFGVIFFQHFVTEQVPQILDALFGCTLEMINKV